MEGTGTNLAPPPDPRSSPGPSVGSRQDPPPGPRSSPRLSVRSRQDPPPGPRSSPGPSVGSRQEDPQPLSVSPVSPVHPWALATNRVGWEPISEQRGYYDEQDFLRPSSNLSREKLRKRNEDDVVVFGYSLDSDYLKREPKYQWVEGGDLSSGPFSEEDVVFSQVSKDRFAKSEEFDQIVDPEGKPRQTPSRGLKMNIIDFPQCYDTYDFKLLSPIGEKLALRRMDGSDFAETYVQRVQALPGRGRFRTGVSLWAYPKQPLEAAPPGSPENRLILSASFPYFGESGGRITLGSESESVTLLDFNSLGSRVRGRRPVASGEKKEDVVEILVHQARYIVFDNFTMATFRSKEDIVKDQVPLHLFQERIGAFRAMIHMIANRMESELGVLGKLQGSLGELERDIDQMMSDGEAYEGNQEMGIIPADIQHQGELTLGVAPSASVQQGGRQDHEGARRNSVQKRKPGNVQDLFASFNGLSAGLFAATSVAERQVAVLRDLQSVFSTSRRNPGYVRNASMIPILSDYPVQISTINSTIEELVQEREAFIKKLKNLAEYMEIRRYILFGFLRCAADKRKEEKLVEQAQTLSSFAIVTTPFIPLGFFTSYFGMNNINEFKRPMSRQDFWLITGPISAAILLLTVVMVLWKNPKVAKFRVYVREKLRRSPKRKKSDLENQISHTCNPQEPFTEDIPLESMGAPGVEVQRVEGEQPQEEEVPEEEVPEEEAPEEEAPQEEAQGGHIPSPPPHALDSRVWTLHPSINEDPAVTPEISGRAPGIPR